MEPNEGKTAHVRLKTDRLIRNLSLFLFAVFGFAVFFFQSTDLHERLQLARQSLVLRPNDPEIRRTMRSLAARYEKEGLSDKSIETYENLLAKEGSISPTAGVAGMLREADDKSLELLYKEHHKYSKLVAIHQARLENREREYGLNIPQLIDAIDHLADAQALAGQQIEADLLKKRSKNIFNDALTRLREKEGLKSRL